MNKRSHEVSAAILIVLTVAATSVVSHAAEPSTWRKTATIEAPEAVQAAAADGRFVYAVSSTQVAKYDRATAERLAVSSGPAKHLNSAFVWKGRVYCAHSNYPQRPEQSEIKVLDPATMKLETFKEFGDFGGSLTWAIRRDGHWWCNFAFYGDDNGRTYLVKFDDDWREQRRWTYPESVIERLGNYSLSGGIWKGDELLVTGHDDAIAFRLKLPDSGTELEFVGVYEIPFTGQGIADDPRTEGLVGISRAKRQVIFAAPPAD